MKKKRISKIVKGSNGDDIRAEYDFSTGTRGKHYKSRLNGYTIRIHQQDGTTEVREVEREGYVVLEPDVKKYFPNSEAVNRALRGLIELFPQNHA
jgi:hypothetical protein